MAGYDPFADRHASPRPTGRGTTPPRAGGEQVSLPTLGYQSPIHQSPQARLPHQAGFRQGFHTPPPVQHDPAYEHPTEAMHGLYAGGHDFEGSQVTLGGESKYDQDLGGAGGSEEALPLRGKSPYVGAGNFGPPPGSRADYPPLSAHERPPLPAGLPAEYGFPSNTGFEGSGYSGSNGGLYRSQTTAEAWGKRQRIDRNKAKTVKRKLEQGNFIADYPVPSAFALQVFCT